MTPGFTAETLTRMRSAGVAPEDFFTLPTPELCDALGACGVGIFEQMHRDEALFAARKEYENIARHNIDCLFLGEGEYPSRLAEIPDPPIVIYKYGKAALDSAHMISVVGTRHCTAYGIGFTDRLVKDLAAYFPDLTVVSGLAFGIDAAAHNAALQAGVPTVAVVAHGLNMIYPAQNRELAKKIVADGGAIITQYPYLDRPFRQRFLERNRIVAALSDVTVVTESDVKGGAMSTANTAFHYNRDVMALPGRISDQYSAGCNLLIRKQKAHMVSSAADVIETTGWEPLGAAIKPEQRNLFPELDGDFKNIYEVLRFSPEPMQLDQIHARTLIPIASLMATLGEMEFEGIVMRHPGNRYSPA